MKKNVKETKASNFPFELPEHFFATISYRQPSTYVQEGNGEQGQNIPFDAPSAKMVKRVSNIMVKDKELDRWVVKQLRYLQGCPTIWVEEQEAMSFKQSNPAASNIWFEQEGTISFAVQGYNIQKAMFLLLHENNSSFEGNDEYRRPDGAADVFEVVDTQRNAEKEVEDFDFAFEAQAYLRSLKKKDGKGGQAYNVDRLEFLSQLFKLPKFDTEQEGKYGAETFTSLVAIANQNPKKFIATIGRYESVVEADCNRAVAAGVIAIDEAGVSFPQSGKVFLTFPSDKLQTSERRRMVLDYFLNPANHKVYETLRAQSEAGLKKESTVITD